MLLGPVRRLVRFSGGDGLAMLALSLAVAALSGGVSVALALAHVRRVAARTPAHADPADERGAPGRILVLGVRLGRDGRPGPLYRARLDRARRLLAAHPGAEVVLLGGRTRPGLPSEAQAGRDHLRAHGVPDAAIRTEAESRHTLENLRLYRDGFSRDGARQTGRVVLVTSRFHLARAGLMAETLGIAHRLCAAEAEWRAVPGALLREALLVHWFLVGRTYCRLTRHERMLARIT